MDALGAMVAATGQVQGSDGTQPSLTGIWEESFSQGGAEKAASQGRTWQQPGHHDGPFSKVNSKIS